MKVEVKLSPDIGDAYAVIHASTITDEIREIITVIEGSQGEIITARDSERIIVLQPTEIFLVRTEGEKTMVHTRSSAYVSQKRLYEMEAMLGNGFMRVSKSSIINLKEIDSVSFSFSGTMVLTLKNGMEDYISRKYLPDFKKYLGI